MGANERLCNGTPFMLEKISTSCRNQLLLDLFLGRLRPPKWLTSTLCSYFVSYWQKYVHEVLVNLLIGGLSLPRKSVVRLTDHPDMTLDVYCGRKTTMQQQC